MASGKWKLYLTRFAVITGRVNSSEKHTGMLPMGGARGTSALQHSPQAVPLLWLTTAKYPIFSKTVHPQSLQHR